MPCRGLLFVWFISGTVSILITNDLIADGDGRTTGDLIRRLGAAEEATREEASQRVVAERKEIIEALLRNISAYDGRAQTHGKAKTAIVLLGKLRAAEAAELIAEKIDFPEALDRLSGGPLEIEEAKPAVGALIEIGFPAVGPTLNKVMATEDESIVIFAGVVLNQIMGTDVAVYLLEEKAAKQSDRRKKDRLLQLKDRVDRVERRLGREGPRWRGAPDRAAEDREDFPP